ncbi:putative membrane protein [Catenulispora sp. GP43]|uniref:anthrone oxygenase family protein n=1 Tax=Catenulispora sp. GP43 TaxID=3156263 RepID=UPI0035190F96
MTPTEQLTTIVATVLTGLVAGTYFAYATSVMLALRGLDDRTFIEVMQKINVTIQNPVFFAAFFGAPAFAAVTVGLQAAKDGASGWTIAALALNIAALLITVAANVPLNNALDAAGEPAAIAEPGAVRARFERAWNAWNATRGVVLITAVVCLGMALRGR